MKNKDITNIALKVFAIFVLVQAVLTIPSLFHLYISMSNGSEFQHSGGFAAISSAAVIILIVLSVLIWRLSSTSIGSINKNSETIISESFILSVLGLYLIFDGVKSTFISSVGLAKSIDTAVDTSGSLLYGTVLLGVYMVQVIIGISLVIKTDGWVSWLNKLRVSGTNR